MINEETGGKQPEETGTANETPSRATGQGSLEAPNATAVPDKPFDLDEIAQFAADDVGVGGAIGKMLSILFIYTIIVMSYVGWATWFKAWPF